MSGRQRRTFEVGPKTKITGTLVEFGKADDVPMGDAAPVKSDNNEDDDPPIEVTTLEGRDAVSVAEKLGFLLDILRTVKIPGTDEKFAFDAPQQHSPRSAFSVLKVLSDFFNALSKEPDEVELLRDNMSPNLNVIIEITKSFSEQANLAQRRGALAQQEFFTSIGQPFDSSIYQVNPALKSLLARNVKNYPLKNLGEEYGMLFKDETYVAVSIDEFESAPDAQKRALVNWEEDLVENPRNMIDVKAIFDQIIDAEQRLETLNATDLDRIEKISPLEPPFYPKLSNLEMQTLLNWQTALQEIRKQMLLDPLYQFAVMVAGLVNKGVNGVEQLLSNKNAYSNLSALTSIPSSSQANSVMSSEREQLHRLKYLLEDAINRQRMSDVRLEQRRLNDFRDPSVFRRGGTDDNESNRLWAENIQKFLSENRATRIEIPARDAPLATRENTPLSPDSRRLMQAKEEIENMLQGFVNENSRSRMFHALEWLQKVEILEKAEITPIFKAGLEMSMASIRMLGCNLKTVPSFMNFVESPDPTVRSYFAQLVALEIADIGNVHPKKNYLDKRYKQVNNRKTRLLEAFDTFSFRGGQIVSDSGGSRSVTMNPAYYAFRG